MLRRFRIRPEWTEEDKTEALIKTQINDMSEYSHLYLYQNDDDVKVGDKVIMVLDGEQPHRCLDCRGREANILSVEKAYEPHPRMLGNIVVHVLNAGCQRHNNCRVYRSEIRRLKAWAEVQTRIQTIIPPLNEGQREDLSDIAQSTGLARLGWSALGYHSYSHLRGPRTGDVVVVLPINTGVDFLACPTRCRSRLGQIEHVESLPYGEDIVGSTYRAIVVRFDLPLDPPSTIPCPVLPLNDSLTCSFNAMELMYRDVDVIQESQEISDAFDYAHEQPYNDVHDEYDYDIEPLH
jgi:hypothetical protein